MTAERPTLSETQTLTHTAAALMDRTYLFFEKSTEELIKAVKSAAEAEAEARYTTRLETELFDRLLNTNHKWAVRVQELLDESYIGGREIADLKTQVHDLSLPYKLEIERLKRELSDAVDALDKLEARQRGWFEKLFWWCS